MRIINNPKFVTGDTFGNLIYNIWRMMSQEIDSRIGQKLGIANQFAFLSGITPYSIISHAIVDLIMPNGCIVKPVLNHWLNKLHNCMYIVRKVMATH